MEAQLQRLNASQVHPEKTRNSSLILKGATGRTTENWFIPNSTSDYKTVSQLWFLERNGFSVTAFSQQEALQPDVPLTNRHNKSLSEKDSGREMSLQEKILQWGGPEHVRASAEEEKHSPLTFILKSGVSAYLRFFYKLVTLRSF